VVRLDFAALAGISADGGGVPGSGLAKAANSAGGRDVIAPVEGWIIRPGD
jgi:hypothetical protein